VIPDVGRSMDDHQLNQLAVNHEESLGTQRFGRFSTAKDILDRVGFR
jgi:hypothetical protein